jgi:hypothetical protein
MRTYLQAKSGMPTLSTGEAQRQWAEPLLSRNAAADFLTRMGFKIAKRSLDKLAVIGGGPPYRIYARRALYLADDLLEWATSRLSAPRHHTSEPLSLDQDAGP